uniref:Uncharacterized protein n=1 Tax=Avena sativa TaxID=4498 RepID=A0ACD5TKY0_AVESA
MGNLCFRGAGRGSIKGSDVAPSPTKGRTNQGPDVVPPPAGSEPNQVFYEAPLPAERTTFKWTIDGLSNLLDRDKRWTYSDVFQIKGLNWFLKLNARDTKTGDQNEYVSLRLELAQLRSYTVVETTYKFLIYDQIYGKHREYQVSHKYEKGSTCSGIPCMIPLAELKDRSSGLYFNKSCVFAVEFISVVVHKANDVSEDLFVQKKTDTQVYTWNIEDFFALKNPSYSPEFELCGHKWSLQLYPSGNDTNGNYLSLYLVMNDRLDKNAAILVESRISIINPETSRRDSGKGWDEYSNNFKNWGWHKFISLEDFKDGYLVKTKCCIEAQVAVVGSSVMK